MSEVLNVVKIVIIAVCSILAVLLLLKLSYDIAKNIKRINNIKRLKSRMDTMAVSAAVLKADTVEKGKEKFRAVYFMYSAEGKSYCKKILLTASALNEISRGENINIYYDRDNPENCILKEDWEEGTYKYYIQWDIAYIFCILIFMTINFWIKII